jgi:glycosyltransferase involved in cell wall biosynthesis
MRVLFWSGAFWPQIGGVEVMASKLLPALRERGYEYLVVAPKSYPYLPDQEQWRGIPVHRFPFWSLMNSGEIEWVTELRQRVAQLKRSFAPHLIHINAVGRGDFFHLTTKNAHPAPLLVTLHGEWSKFGIRRHSVVEQTLRAADWVIGCSAAILEIGR